MEWSGFQGVQERGTEGMLFVTVTWRGMVGDMAKDGRWVTRQKRNGGSDVAKEGTAGLPVNADERACGGGGGEGVATLLVAVTWWKVVGSGCLARRCDVAKIGECHSPAIETRGCVPHLWTALAEGQC